MMKFVTLGTSHGDPTRERFNTSTLLDAEECGILFDAGAPVNALLIRRGVPFGRLRHLFVTHMHEDHIGGIPGLLKSFVKYPVPGQRLTVHLPEEAGIEAILGFLRATHRMPPEELVGFDVLSPGAVYRENGVTVRAVPTRHMENEGLSGVPSFGFCIESEGSRVIYTGDLRFDFADFPRGEFKQPAGCICECTAGPQTGLHACRRPLARRGGRGGVPPSGLGAAVSGCAGARRGRVSILIAALRDRPKGGGR